MQTSYRLRQTLLLLADLAVFLIALFIALFIRNNALPNSNVFLDHIGFLPVFFIWLTINYINGLYDFRGFASATPLPRRVLESGLAALILGIIYFYIIPNTTISPKTILLITVTLGYLGMGIIRLSLFKKTQTLALNRPLLFIGWNEETKELCEIMKTAPDCGLHPVAILSLADPRPDNLPSNIQWYTDPKKIRSIVSTHNIRIVGVSPEARNNNQVVAELYELLFWGINIVDLTSIYEQITGRIPPSSFFEGWFLDHIGSNQHAMHQKWQRGLDIFGATLIGVIFIILLPLTSLLIKITTPGPIFFKQKRVGKNGVTFSLYKFRSMHVLSNDGSAETNGVQFTTKNDTRITPIGKIMRKIRLDELPQTINLFRGDISLIGPRPERPEIVEELTRRMPYYPVRHITKPGLTGWAVLHQNYTDTMETSLQKLQYDLYYIKHRSILLDISILLKTFRIIIRMMGQ